MFPEQEEERTSVAVSHKGRKKGINVSQHKGGSSFYWAILPTCVFFLECRSLVSPPFYCCSNTQTFVLFFWPAIILTTPVSVTHDDLPQRCRDIIHIFPLSSSDFLLSLFLLTSSCLLGCGIERSVSRQEKSCLVSSPRSSASSFYPA